MAPSRMSMAPEGARALAIAAGGSGLGYAFHFDLEVCWMRSTALLDSLLEVPGPIALCVVLGACSTSPAPPPLDAGARDARGTTGDGGPPLTAADFAAAGPYGA